jgi:magnesium transporter
MRPMMFAYALDQGKLRRMDPAEDLRGAIWIDLYRPQAEQIARVETLGLDVPTIEDMEEIEISNRLYLEDDVAYMTAIMPGHTPDKAHVAAPVTFILSKELLVTVRHHAPRPFETFPARAQRSTAGCTTAERAFLGLMEEAVGRQADILEGVGREVDRSALHVYDPEPPGPNELSAALTDMGLQSELLAKVRLCLLTLERVIGFYRAGPGKEPSDKLKPLYSGLTRDIQALEVHADFLSSRIGQLSDAVLGLINLAQNVTVRMLSVVAGLFLPPTLIASIYGMNFDHMPELHTRYGYPVALGAIVLSAVLTYVYFKWKRWL